MKVFLSWSGERSKRMADQLKQNLPLLFPGLVPWFSPHDIAAGERWAKALADQLRAADFGVFCLTPENRFSDWMLFEAGAISKGAKGVRVVPYLLSMRHEDVPKPLQQFQGVAATDKEATFKLVRDLNREHSPRQPEDRFEKSFEQWWPALERAFRDIEKLKPDPPTAPEFLSAQLSTDL